MGRSSGPVLKDAANHHVVGSIDGDGLAIAGLPLAELNADLSRQLPKLTDAVAENVEGVAGGDAQAVCAVGRSAIQARSAPRCSSPGRNMVILQASISPT